MSMLHRAPVRAEFWILTRLASVAVILIGSLVLVGWLLDVEILKCVIPGMTAMNPGGTALAFLLAGVSLWSQSVTAGDRRLRHVGFACAVLVTLIASLRIVGYLIAWDGGPDQFLFREKLDREIPLLGYPNRMAPNTLTSNW